MQTFNIYSDGELKSLIMGSENITSRVETSSGKTWQVVHITSHKVTYDYYLKSLVAKGFILSSIHAENKKRLRVVFKLDLSAQTPTKQEEKTS